MKMKITYVFFIAAFCSLFSVKTIAQVASIPFTASLDTFSAITGTTVDVPGADDISYQNIPIGFNFDLGGTIHDRMSINTNGYIELDSAGTGLFFNILSGTRNNVVAPFGADLIHSFSNPNASLQYLTFGTAPNRICVVQWLHYSYFGGSGDVNVQLWMYETTNCIRFVYGTNNLVSNPLRTQIGLRGTSSSDFNVLGDSTCNWANAYPYPSITTSFPVSLTCNMPSGFAFHFGACGYNSNVNFGYITGTVFNDINGNGTLDSGETGIANHVVNIVPGNYYVSSDAIGNYAFFFSDSSLNYSISTNPMTYWIQTNSPAVLSCQPLTQSCSGLNLGLQQIPNVHEVSITCPAWGAKPGQPEPMPIWYRNNGTTTESDTITFVMDSSYSFISSTPAPIAVNGQTIQWAYTNLLPNQSGHIMLYLMPSLSLVLGNYINSSLTIAPLNDTIPTNNVLNLHQLITLAWDPNEKLALPSGIIPAGTTIDYSIHFQNTGNATADNVTVKDTLDANLDPLTFVLGGASHTMNFSMDEHGIATFTFFNIQLPDSGSDLAGSNGYVNYSIKTKDGLAPLTVINNRAGIIFDSNIPVMTNTTTDIIEMITSVNNFEMNTFYLSASPNPVSQNVVFAFSTNQKERADLTIRSIDGHLVMTKENISSTESVDLGFLSPGVYSCTVQSISGIRTVKVVKK